MTKDEMKRLSDKELQVKAAELDGWKYVRRYIVPGAMGPTELRGVSPSLLASGILTKLLEQDPSGDILAYGNTEPIPDYLNDIAAARELEDFLFQTYADGEVEDTELVSPERSGLQGPMGQLGQEFTQWQNAHPWARYIDALGRILDIRLGLLAYEDFGTVQYKDIFALVHASPRDRTRAFVLAMTQEGSGTAMVTKKKPKYKLKERRRRDA